MTLVASRSTDFSEERSNSAHLTSSSHGIVTLPSLHLRHGGSLDQLQVAYQLTGAKQGPVIVVQGGISADHHVCATPSNPTPGWWQEMVGVEGVIDTRQFRILSFDYLGGNGYTTGPRTKRFEGRPFPTISTMDQAHLLALLLDELDIPRLHAYIGASYGGMVGLAFGQIAPQRLGRLICIAAAHRGSQLAIAWRSLQRQIVSFAQQQGKVLEGVKLARALAMTTYRSREEFDQRFSSEPRQEGAELRFEVEDYLNHCADTFAQQFHSESFIRLSESLDLHQVYPEAIAVVTTLIGFHNDHLVPIEDLRKLSQRLPNLHQLYELNALHGHDSFLKNPHGLVHALEAGLNAQEVRA